MIKGDATFYPTWTKFTAHVPAKHVPPSGGTSHSLHGCHGHPVNLACECTSWLLPGPPPPPVHAPRHAVLPSQAFGQFVLELNSSNLNTTNNQLYDFGSFL